MASRAFRQQDCSVDRTLRSSPSTRSLSTLASYTSQSSAYVYAGSPCGCDMTLVSDSQNRPSKPLRRGNIVWIYAHFLAALKPFLKETDLGPADVVDLTRSSSTASPSTRKNPRPCIVWNLENERGGTVAVLLAGTYEGSTYTKLPQVLKNWVIGLFNESVNEDWTAIDHIHASPQWRYKATSWIIPFPVIVPTSALQLDAHCKYINDASMRRLVSFHDVMRGQYDLVLLHSPTRKEVAQELLSYSRIKQIIYKESPLYDAPSPIAGPSRHSTWPFSGSSLTVAPTSDSMRPPTKRMRYADPVPVEQRHDGGRGVRRAEGRGGGNASSQRDTSRSRDRGTYHPSTSGRSTPSLSRQSAAHRSETSLNSQSSRVSHASRSSHGPHSSQSSHASRSSSDYFTANSRTSGSGSRTRNASVVSNESEIWRSSGGWDIARDRRDSGALERRESGAFERRESSALERRGSSALERRASSVRVEKRKHSPTTPTAPRAMREAWPQTPVPAEVPSLMQPFPELPHLALPRPEALRLALPETPQKSTAQPQKALAPPETPRKTRAEAALLASLKKLSPPSLKNFGRRHSKENAETPTRERGDPLSPKEPSLRPSSRANSLCSSSRPNSTPSSPKTGKKASALMSPLNKVAHLLRVGGGRPASRAPSEDGRD